MVVLIISQLIVRHPNSIDFTHILTHLDVIQKGYAWEYLFFYEIAPTPYPPPQKKQKNTTTQPPHPPPFVDASTLLKQSQPFLFGCYQSKLDVL